VNAQVRFRRIMSGREPRSVHAGILAAGTNLAAAQCACTIPQLPAASIRQAMRWAGDERRLRLGCQAVLGHMPLGIQETQFYLLVAVAMFGEDGARMGARAGKSGLGVRRARWSWGLSGELAATAWAQGRHSALRD
jgi:hypothetical protein